jgi:hypothetical protein
MQRVRSVRFDGFTIIGATNIFNLEIGDVIVITDAQTVISTEKYLIVGVRYGLWDGTPAKTEVEFTVRRLDDQTYWLLQDSTYGKLGSTTRLGI